MTTSIDELESAASRAAGGLTDFGGDDHHRGLGVLLEAAASGPHAGPGLDARVRHSAIGALGVAAVVTGRLDGAARLP